MQSIAAHQILGSHVRTCYRLLDGASRATCEGPCMDATYMSPRPARRMRAITANADVDGRPGMLPSSATCSVTLIVSCRSRSSGFSRRHGICSVARIHRLVRKPFGVVFCRMFARSPCSSTFATFFEDFFDDFAADCSWRDRALRSHSATDRFCRPTYSGACFLAACTPPMRAQTAH